MKIVGNRDSAHWISLVGFYFIFQNRNMGKLVPTVRLSKKVLVKCVPIVPLKGNVKFVCSKLPAAQNFKYNRTSEFGSNKPDSSENVEMTDGHSCKMKLPTSKVVPRKTSCLYPI